MTKRTIISVIQNILMVLLFTAMLALCVYYISNAPNREDDTLPPFPKSGSIYLSNGSLSTGDTGGSFIIPCFVGVITETERFGGTFSDDQAYEIFGLFTQILDGAPGGTVKKIVFSDEQQKYDYLERLYNTSAESYYMRFENGIEFSVLCQIVSDTYTDIPQNPDFEIQDMFLVKGSLGEAGITAVDTFGNVIKVFPEKTIPFNTEYLETYNKTEHHEFEFVKIEDNVAGKRNCYFPSFRYTIPFRDIIRYEFSECFDLGVDATGKGSTDVRELIAIFGMNADKTSFHVQSNDGSVKCTETATTFEISQNGVFEFVPDRDGGKLDLYLDNFDGTDFGFFEYYKTAKSILESLDKKFEMYCDDITLDDITYKNGRYCFRYNYTVDGIPVECENGYVLELEFSADRLVRAGGNLSAIQYADTESSYIPQRAAYVLMDTKGKPVSYFGAEYCFEDNTSGKSKASVKWSVRTEDVGGDGR